MSPEDVQKRRHDANAEQRENNASFPVANGEAVEARVFAADDDNNEQRHEQVRMTRSQYLYGVML